MNHLLAFLALTLAFQFTHAGIRVENCVIREPASGANMTAVYFDLDYVVDDFTESLKLPGPEAIQAAHLDALSNRVALHKSTMKDGVMRMQPIPRFNLKEGALRFKPGGLHLMIKDLKKHPKAGETYPIQIWFSYHPDLTCEAVVKTSADIATAYQ